jgi:hypothetical protein
MNHLTMTPNQLPSSWHKPLTLLVLKSALKPERKQWITKKNALACVVMEFSITSPVIILAYQSHKFRSL